MKNTSCKAERDMPILKKRLAQLHKIAEEMTTGPIECAESDHLGFMVLSFLNKQIDHASSIFALKIGRDSGLIVRSMLEGMCQLLWASNDPSNRALRWRTFSLVHDWRIMRLQIHHGEFVDPTQQKAINTALQKYGEQFFTRRSRSAQREGKPLPKNPYHNNWTGLPVRQIFKEVGADELYLKIYKPLSDWHHWSPGGLGEAIYRQNGNVLYSSMSLENTAMVLATAYQCLFHTVELMDRHFTLGFSEKIATVKNNYIADLAGG